MESAAAVDTEGDAPQWESYEVEKIIDKRIRTRRNKKVLQYRLRWQGYGPEHDLWRSITTLGNCLQLVEEFESRQTVARTATGVMKAQKRGTPVGNTVPRARLQLLETRRSSTTSRRLMLIIPQSIPPDTPATSDARAAETILNLVEPRLRRSNRLRRT